MSDTTTAVAERSKQSLAVSTVRAKQMEEALVEQAEQRRVLGRFIKDHMIENVDFGKLPGTDKPTLYKPGAEKLTSLFRCAPRYKQTKCVEDWDRPLFHYEFKCEIVLLDSDTVISEGVGSCNSREARYRWRNANRKCPKCGKEAIHRSKFPPRDQPDDPPGWYCYGKKGGCGQNFDYDDSDIIEQPQGRVENPDIADMVNTVLKIAKKRSLVDAAIALTRCSDMFTQDVEDFRRGEEDEEETPTPRRNVEPTPEAKRVTEALHECDWYWDNPETRQWFSKKLGRELGELATLTAAEADKIVGICKKHLESKKAPAKQEAPKAEPRDDKQPEQKQSEANGPKIGAGVVASIINGLSDLKMDWPQLKAVLPAMLCGDNRGPAFEALTKRFAGDAPIGELTAAEATKVLDWMRARGQAKQQKPKGAA